jgi:hypothetical protein
MMFPDYVKFKTYEEAEWYVEYLASKNIKASIREHVVYMVVPDGDK